MIPRAFLKRLKQNGQNIQISVSAGTIKRAQVDRKGDYICAACEKKTAIDDGYGANTLIHKKGITTKPFNTTNCRFEVMEKLDYAKFKKFIISIVMRDHFCRKEYGIKPLLPPRKIIRLKNEYNNPAAKKTISIVANKLKLSDPLSKMVTDPVLSKKKDGISFQLFEYQILLYFDAPKYNISAIELSLKGTLLMLVLNHQQTGALGTFGSNYKKIVNDPKNKKNLDKINKEK